MKFYFDKCKLELRLTMSILIYFFFTAHSFAFEIILENGDAFICDLITETDKSYKILYKSKEYFIPKADVKSTDPTKKGAYSAFRYSVFTLKDGSKINGVIAEEKVDSFTLKTEIGFLVVEKPRIADMPANAKIPPELSSNYLASNVRLPDTRIGLFGSGYINGSPISNSNPSSVGGGLYVEPAFLLWRFIRFGLRTEYLQSLSSGNTITFFNNTVYAGMNKAFFEKPILDFYLNLGASASNVSYRKGSESFSGINPGGYFEVGWQGIKFKNMYIRLGLNAFCNFESLGNFCAGGGSLGLGVKF